MLSNNVCFITLDSLEISTFFFILQTYPVRKCPEAQVFSLHIKAALCEDVNNSVT